MRKYNILVFGASYGALLAAKMLAAGHNAKLVCRSARAHAINRDGVRVRMPLKGPDRLVEIDTRTLPGELSADGPHAINASQYDLAVLAMQEPQYGAPGVRELLGAVAEAAIPCLSIMNMPPPPYLARLPGLSTEALLDSYTDAQVWTHFDPERVTLCSPDPQAFCPPNEKLNVLQVRLATNFKAARFGSDAHTQILRDLEQGIEAARFEAESGPVELPVKLKVHESLFVPLAKWSMLLAGNYRCIGKNGMRSIADAVHSDLNASRRIYDWVVELCRSLGAAENDLVPFEKYANAALSLRTPSSAARALEAGATAIERVDRLVQAIALQRGVQNDAIDEAVEGVDRWLERNRLRTGRCAA